MTLRKSLVAAIAGCAISLGSGPAAAVEALCSSISTIAGWASAGSCLQGDKIWTFTGQENLLGAGVKLEFGGDDLFTHNLQITGFDTKDTAGSWEIKYDISVVDVSKFFISDMFAGADNPGGGSHLRKDVTGDPGGPFSLFDNDGAEGPLSEKHGLTANLLHIDEKFDAPAGKTLLSVSNTFTESPKEIPVPTPGTLSLLGLGLIALGAIRRTRRES